MKSCEACIRKVFSINSRSSGAREHCRVLTVSNEASDAYIFPNNKLLIENTPQVSLTADMEEILFANIDLLIDLRFQKFPGMLNYIDEEYYRNSARVFWPLQYALCASGSLFATPEMVPKGLDNRLEMSLAYIKKALTFKLFTSPDHLHVLALTEIGSAYLTDSDAESFGKEIMQNSEWFTPCVTKNSVMGYRILLHRIGLRIQKYILMELSDTPVNTGYIFGSLCGSLREWFECVRKEMCNHYSSILEKKCKDPALSWLAIFTILIYNNNVLELVFPKFMKNVLLGKKVQNSLYFSEAQESTLFNSSILNAIKLYNPQMEHLNPQLFKFTFKSAFFLQCMLKIHETTTTKIEDAYKLHLESLLAQGIAFQRTNNFYNILVHLRSIDLYHSVLKFGEFSARKFDVAFEKPQARNTKCIYLSKQEVIDKYAEMEDRIKKLEMQLIIPLKYTGDTKDPIAENAPQVSITEEMEKILFTNNDYLIDLRFQKFPGMLNYIDEEYYRNSAKLFWPLQYALYASGSLFVTPNMVPKGLENRLEMSLAYIKKALTFNFFSNPDQLHILALTEIGSAYFRLDRIEGHRYIKLAVQIAKSIGMNTEEGISKLAVFDYELENIRRLWWLLFTIYTITTKLFGVDLITDEDNQLYLPSNIYFKEESDLDLYSREIMNSTEWFTPCIRNQSIMGYKILLHRIESRIQKYILLELSEFPESTDYIFGSLCGSLREWYKCTHGLINQHYSLILAGKCSNPALSWLALFTVMIYNDNVLELIFPKFMKNVLLDKRVQNSLYFHEAKEATLHNSSILHAIKFYNPLMEHLNIHLFKMTFKSAFFLQCILKIPQIGTIQIEAAHKLHMESLLAQGKVFQRTNNFYNILVYLKDFDLYNSVLKFGEFSARKFDVAFEKPQAKRKCDRKKPCSLCNSRKTPCVYGEKLDLQTRLSLIEDRIKKLEQLLILPTKYSWEINYQNPNRVAPIYQIPETLENDIFNQTHDYLLDLRLVKCPITYFFTTAEYLVASCQQSAPLRYAQYAIGSLFLSDTEKIPKQLNSRVELANIFLEKAKTFNFFERRDPLNVMALSEMVQVLILLNRLPEAKLYFKLAYFLARDIGMTTEDGISDLSPFDYEKENIRGVWWNFHTLGILLNERFDSEVEVYLPSNYVFETRTDKDIYGIQIMNSYEWYTCSLPRQSFAAYRVLLKRIQGKVMNYTHLEMRGETSEGPYIIGSIAGSLNEWVTATQSYIIGHINLILAHQVKVPLATWTTVYTKLSFNYLRIELIMGRLIKTVLENKNVFAILQLNEAIAAALDNTYLLQLITQHNPAFDYLIGHIGVMMFPSAFLLQCVTKFPKSKKFKLNYTNLQCAFQVHLESLQLYASAFQRENTYYQLLAQMRDLDLYNAVLTFGELKSSGSELVIQRARPAPVELLSKLKLKE
ncbi:hypothetical protein HDV01_001058 [Terramyces sp. JEL0728]|nr:hypothetical protein HDV01_001058 [Terramyces sp. JEL0728]